MAEQLAKWLKRTELQAVALVVVLILANHFLAWGLSIWDILAAAGVSSAYAISRGMAKHGGATTGCVLLEVLLVVCTFAIVALVVVAAVLD